MSKSGEQLRKKTEEEERAEEKASKLRGLPMESSPYLKYTDLEDYKRQGYGTEGHLEPKPNQGGGGTDAPTLAGTDLSKGPASVVDAAHRVGIPWSKHM